MKKDVTAGMQIALEQLELVHITLFILRKIENSFVKNLSIPIVYLSIYVHVIT